MLADYVLALIRADTPEAELKVNAIENLEDFLKDSMSSTVAFRARSSSGALLIVFVSIQTRQGLLMKSSS